MARRIEVEIIGDSRSLERAFDRSAKSAKRFEAQISGVGTSFKKVFAGAAAAVGVGVVVDQLRGAVDAASDLLEQMSKTNVVFGRSATGIQEWSKTTATAMGLSQRQALATASSFGAMFAPLGIVGRQAAEQSQNLTKLGADLASFYNTDVASALDAIRSGIVGESEPLRRYGVLLSETRVQAEAMAETGKKTASALTDQEKVTARIAIIMRDASQAQGDFARTSGGLANQQRILTAQVDDLKTGLGEALLPAITNVVTKFNEWLADPENKKKVIDGFASAVHGLGEAFQLAADTAGFLKSAWDKLPDFGKSHGLLDFLKFGSGGTGFIPGDFTSAGGAGGGGNFASAAAAAVSKAAKAAKAAATSTAAAGLSGERRGDRRNAWFDDMIRRQLGRVQDITSLKGQIGRLGVIADLIRQRLAVTKDVTRRLTLEDQLLDVLRTQRQTKSSLADELTRRADDAKEAARKTREANQAMVAAAIGGVKLGVEGTLTIGQVNKAVTANTRKAAERAQFRALGFTAEGDERTPGVKALRRQAAALTRALAGTILDTKSNRGILRRIREVLSGELGAISKTMRERIGQMIADLDSQVGGAGRKKGKKRVGGITVDKWGNAIGPGLPQERHVPSVIGRFTGAVEKATEALTGLQKLELFADLRNFGGNLWSRAGGAGMAGRMTGPGTLEQMPRIGRGGGPGRPMLGGGQGRQLLGGGTVVVNQHFNAPTTDRHREARYALMATRAVFDS